jgi:hypothetical protein
LCWQVREGARLDNGIECDVPGVRLCGRSCPDRSAHSKGKRFEEGREMSETRATSMKGVVVLLIGFAGALPGAANGQGAGSAMEHQSGKGMQMSMGTSGAGGMHMEMGMMRADSHAPLGVVGAETMMKGMLMVSYRYMRMEMEDNLIGTDNVSPEQIVTSVPNRFFGLPGQPPTLRVVPTEMSTDMHMFGAMYAPADRVTLMAMIPYLRRSMDHVTFAGPTGTTRRGTFTTESSGFAWESGGHRIHVNAGLSLPTGSIDEEDDVLAPTGARPTLRLPYPMQLGSGTFDLMPGVTYKGRSGSFGWGAQYLATIRLGDNDEGYSLGDIHHATGWASYSWQPAVSASFRLTGRTQDSIDGIDPRIVAPVQTANPAFQGGDRVDLGFGLNFSGQSGAMQGLRAAIEFGLPVHQDLNGPQMEADWSLTAGVRYMF